MAVEESPSGNRTQGVSKKLLTEAKSWRDRLRTLLCPSLPSLCGEARALSRPPVDELSTVPPPREVVHKLPPPQLGAQDCNAKATKCHHLVKIKPRNRNSADIEKLRCFSCAPKFGAWDTSPPQCCCYHYLCHCYGCLHAWSLLTSARAQVETLTHPGSSLLLLLLQV